MKDDLLDELNKQSVDETKPIVTLYMTEIKRYPNGREYVKSWLVKKGNFQPKKKVTKKKELQEVTLEQCTEEVY